MSDTCTHACGCCQRNGEAEVARLRAVNAGLVREAEKLLDLIPCTLKGRLGDGLRVAVARAKGETP